MLLEEYGAGSVLELGLGLELPSPRVLFAFSSSFLSSLLINKSPMTLNFLARKIPKKIIRKPRKKTNRFLLSSPSHCGYNPPIAAAVPDGGYASISRYPGGVLLILKSRET